MCALTMSFNIIMVFEGMRACCEKKKASMMIECSGWCQDKNAGYEDRRYAMSDIKISTSDIGCIMSDLIFTTSVRSVFFMRAIGEWADEKKGGRQDCRWK